MMKFHTLMLLAAVGLNACSSPAPDSGGGGGSSGSTPQAVAPQAPPIDDDLLGVWNFDGQIRGDDIVMCGRDVVCDREYLRFVADGTMVIDSAKLGVTSCVWKASNKELTYQCGNNAPITQNYQVSAITLCIWQSPGFAYCYSHG